MQARVIVDVNVNNLDKPFFYRVPKEYEEIIELGMRVYVPFGNRSILGYVVKLEEETETNLKDIHEILDIIPTINEELIKLSHEIKKQTFSNYISIFNTMVPSAFRLNQKKYLEVINKDKLDLLTQSLFDKEVIVYDKNKITQSTLHKYVKSGDIRVINEFNEKGIKKYITNVILNENIEVKLTPKEKTVIDFLTYHKTYEKIKLQKDLNVTSAVINNIVKKGIVSLEEVEVYRDLNIEADPVKNIILNEEQERAIKSILKHSNTFNEFLLFGVTGSGKTEVYIELIKSVLSDNKNILLLVPEISLTPQIVRRFKGIFNEDIAILHSGLSDSERFDEFRRINNSEAKIVIGARSAVFAPLKNIGLIIIDECHTDSYKQDNDPRYHTLDIAKLRAQYHNALLVYGSATPSVEMYYKALNGQIRLIELSKRANEMLLPNVDLVDMRLENTYKDSLVFSKRLIDKITQKLIKKEQVILLVNRKGFAEYIMCRDCGHVKKCPNCDISLTYHKNTNTLKCSYCNHQEIHNTHCNECGSSKLMNMGMGTEMVEEEIQNIFPGVGVLRMDSETTKGKNSLDKIYKAFKDKKASILIGTQMVAKGLDFEDVTLVGVLNADNSLFFPDYKASENTFQLLTQVIGRSGRHKKGEVLIQTFNTEHYAITASQKHSYFDFYNQEISYREKCEYPPFTLMTQIILSNEDLNTLREEANKIKKHLKSLNSNYVVLGPILPKVMKVNNKYRIQLVVKHNGEKDLNSNLIKIKQYYNDKSVSIIIDNYPYLI